MARRLGSLPSLILGMGERMPALISFGQASRQSSGVVVGKVGSLNIGDKYNPATSLSPAALSHCSLAKANYLTGARETTASTRSAGGKQAVILSLTAARQILFLSSQSVQDGYTNLSLIRRTLVSFQDDIVQADLPGSV